MSREGGRKPNVTAQNSKEKSPLHSRKGCQQFQMLLKGGPGKVSIGFSRKEVIGDNDKN